MIISAFSCDHDRKLAKLSNYDLYQRTFLLSWKKKKKQNKISSLR